MPDKKTPPSLDPINIHVMQKQAAEGDRKRRAAIEAMTPKEQERFGSMPKSRQDEILGMPAGERSGAIMGVKDPGAPGGPMDPFVKGAPPKVGKRPQAIVPDEKKKEEKKEEKKEDKKEPKKTSKWINIIIGIIIAIFVISYGYYLYKCITNMSKPKTFKNVAECFFTALVIIFKKIFDFFSNVSEKIKTNIPVNSQSAAAAASESAVDLVTNNPPVQPVNPLAHSAVSIP